MKTRFNLEKEKKRSSIWFLKKYKNNFFLSPLYESLEGRGRWEGFGGKRIRETNRENFHLFWEIIVVDNGK